MSQASRETALRRIEAGLDRLALIIRDLPRMDGPAPAGTVTRDVHEALLAAHSLLRTRAEAAVAGIDRLLQENGSSG